MEYYIFSYEYLIRFFIKGDSFNIKSNDRATNGISQFDLRSACKQFARAHMCAWAYTFNTYPTLEQRILSFVQSRLCISVDTEV